MTNEEEEVNSYKLVNERNIFKNHPLLPNNIRGIICGPSNCGKTTLLFRFLLKDYIEYNRLYIFSKSLNQPEYKLLIRGFKKQLQPAMIDEIFKNANKLTDMNSNEIIDEMVEAAEKAHPDGSWKSTIEIFPFTDINDIPDIGAIDDKKRNLFIFDDCIEDPHQKPIQAFFTRGRHVSCQCLYLTQSYFKLDRMLIRNNANLLILFKINDRDVRTIYSDFISTDIGSCDSFLQFCKRVWVKKYNFVMIDKFNDDLNKKYRNGFSDETFKVREIID